jgi:hypothetical protein
MPHSITHGNACFTYFNKNWGNPLGRTCLYARMRPCLGRCVQLAV